MKPLLCALWLSSVVAYAAGPEKGPYAPRLPSDFLRADGEVYPTALGARPWKPEDPSAYAGEFVDVSNPALKVEIQVAKSRAGEWLVDGNWRRKDLREHPQLVSWKRAHLELDTKHTYAHAARGTLFIFFVHYRDPDVKDGALRPAVMIGDHLFAKQ